MTRTRSVPANQTHVDYYLDSTNLWADGTWNEDPYGPDYSWSSPYTTWSMTDVVTPRYKERISKGEIVNNPMNSKIRRYEESLASVYISRLKDRIEDGEVQYTTGSRVSGLCPASRFLGKATTWPGQFIETAEQLAISKSEVESLAVNRAWANVDASEAQILETMGELPETIRYLESAFRRVIRIAKSVRKLDLKALKGEISPKELRDRYLEARYAIRPLYYDVSDISKAVASKNSFKEVRRTFRGFHSESRDESDMNKSIPSPEPNNFTLSINSTSNRTVEARAGVLTAIDLLNPPSIWGVDQPIEAIWEFVPWSFILDWFYNIGDTIAAWTPNYGIKSLASWCVITDTRTLRVELANIEPVEAGFNNEDIINVDNCYLSRLWKTKERVISPRRPILPVRNVRLDSLKLIDLAAILWSLKDGAQVAKVTRS